MLKLLQKPAQCHQPEIESSEPQFPDGNHSEKAVHPQTETPAVDAIIATSSGEASHFETLEDKDREKFKHFKISDGWVKRVQISRVADYQAREALGMTFKEFPGDLSGLLIPYLNWSDGTCISMRLKLDNPPVDVDGKKKGKYRSPKGVPKPLYFVRGVNYAAPEGLIVLVESEMSAIAIANLAERNLRKLLPIAMGGCTGWSTPVKGPDGEKLCSIPLADLDVCIGRRVILVFDENASTNHDIRLARAKLAFWLESERYKATVRIATVPQIKEACGPDDLIAEKGDQEFLKMLDNAGTLRAVADADAKAAIESIDKTNPDLAKQFQNAASAIAFVSDSIHSKILRGQLAKAVHGVIPKETITEEISKYAHSWQQQEAKIAQQVKEAMTSGLASWQLAALLEKIRNFILRFVVLSEAQANTIAIFVAYTYLWEIFDFAPYINVKSPEKRCGKTLFLEVIEILIRNPWLTQRTTAASLIDKLSSEKLVLLLDENDQAFKGDKDYAALLTQLLNAGHRKGGKATKCVGMDNKAKDFDVFGPKVLAGIGNLPDTIEDRSIPILLKRKLPSEKVERFRLRLIAKEAAEIRKTLANLPTPTIKTQLASKWPELPSELSDRQQDISEPLLAVADYAGPEWGTIIRTSLVELFSGTAEDFSLDVKLLADIRSVFIEKKVDRMSSKDLVAALIDIEASPWAESEHGKPLTTTALAQRLKKFKISPRPIRIKDLAPNGTSSAVKEVFKGYLLTFFQEVFERYCPSVTPQQPVTDGLQTGCNASATEGMPSNDAPCNSVTPVTANTEEEGGELVNA